MDNYKKLFRYLVISLTSLLLIVNCNQKTLPQEKVLTGADLLISENFDLIKNKNLGIITNHTALLSDGTHLVDTLFSIKDTKIISLFGPEHGIRGDAPDGYSIENGFDSKTNLPVFSLYGKTRKLSVDMLKDIDILIFDIQDIGARFYTFISTMFYAIQAASENSIPIIILDRPNPINGIDVQGPVLEIEKKSFVGIAEIPIRHGMTVGELALYFNQESLLGSAKAELKIIKMRNWLREYYYDDCNIQWTKPSPNMPTLETAIVYPGLCLIEGTNFSEGRGTLEPFLQIGAPNLNSADIVKAINLFNPPGINIKPISYTPEAIPNMSMYPKYIGELCNGIKLNITDASKFRPIEFGINLIYVFHKLYPQKFSFRDNWIDKLWGSSKLREAIIAGEKPKSVINSYQKKLEEFKKNRKSYLLYE